MKGIVFTVFLDMVEEKFGLSVADSLLSTSNIPRERAYTSVGNYPAEEMFALIGRMAEMTQLPVEQLIDAYSICLLKALLDRHGALLGNIKNTFALLETLNDHIHVQVKKLYPDAELPYFDAKIIDEYNMELLYKSPRNMALLAAGLIRATAKHFGEEMAIRSEAVGTESDSAVRFFVTKGR